METSQTNSDYVNRTNLQLPCVGDCRHETYKTKTKNRVDQPSEAADQIDIRPVSELFADVVDYRDYRLIEKYSRYKDDVANELSNMTKKISLQLKERTFVVMYSL